MKPECMKQIYSEFISIEEVLAKGSERWIIFYDLFIDYCHVGWL